MTEIKEKFGLIVLLDALGIQGASLEESKAFVKHLKQHSDEARGYLRGYASAEGIGENHEVHQHYKNVEPISRTFGDTFMIAWELPRETKIIEYIKAMSASLSYVITSGIETGVLFRGAISVGNYLESETTIIGPAITDAASWYERANWFGCITTPNCTQRINAEVLNVASIFRLIRYDVPFKSIDNIELWCVNWHETIHKSEREELLKWYYENISTLDIPVGTEEKYINSEKFFRYCIDNKV